jgi:hypothetical protein
LHLANCYYYLTCLAHLVENFIRLFTPSSHQDLSKRDPRMYNSVNKPRYGSSNCRCTKCTHRKLPAFSANNSAGCSTPAPPLYRVTMPAQLQGIKFYTDAATQLDATTNTPERLDLVCSSKTLMCTHHRPFCCRRR